MVGVEMGVGRLVEVLLRLLLALLPKLLGGVV